MRLHTFFSARTTAAGVALVGRIVLMVAGFALMMRPVVADSPTRLAARDMDFHIATLQLSDSEKGYVEAAFSEYLSKIADAERALAEFATWSGRWTKEHLYWMQLQDWGNRIAPQSWSIRPALDEAHKTLRDRYFAHLKDSFPEKTDRVALLERLTSRAGQLQSILFQGQYPDLVEIVAKCAPHVLDQTNVQRAISQYELRLTPILERRRRLIENQRRDFAKAMEERDTEMLASLNAAIPLNDCEIWQTTNGMIDVFAAALGDPDASAFREAVNAARYPVPLVRSPVSGLIERALNDESLSADIKAQVHGIQNELEAERERVRGELNAAFDSMFDQANIKRVAREQAESMLGIRNGPVSAFDASYQLIVKSLTEKANRLAVELQELIQSE